jgi:hypothetical protein
MTTRSGTLRHIAITLNYALLHPQMFVYTDQDGGRREPMAEQDVIDYVDDLRAKGYRVIPPCDNVRADGTCAGHTKHD